MKLLSKYIRFFLTSFLICSQIFLPVSTAVAMPGVFSVLPPVTPNITTTAFNKFAYNDRSELAESARYLGTNFTVLTSPVTGEYRSFQYDPIGNRTNITAAASNGSYTANNLNQYATATLPTGGTNTFTHDLDGNLTKITGVKNQQYTYDAENRLVSVWPIPPVVNDKKIDNVYDFQGRRVKKSTTTWTGSAWSSPVVKLYVYDGWNVIEEQTTAQPTKYYVWGLDLSQSLQGAGGIGGLLAKVESTTTHNYLFDANGNVGQLTNATTGSVDAKYEYDPYGNTLIATGSQAAGNAYRFSSKYFDSESNLYYYGYCFYAPDTGRWMSRDPREERKHIFSNIESVYRKIDPLYVFVQNNSLDNYDLFGLLTVHIWTFRGKHEAWGHASLTLENNTHISWWPSGVRYNQMPFLPMIYTAEPFPNQLLQDDIKFEKQDPDVQIKINCLDEEKIEQWWKIFKKTYKWKTLTQNCSTTVADALKAGGSPETGKYVWTPAEVEKYARRIQAMEGTK